MGRRGRGRAIVVGVLLALASGCGSNDLLGPEAAQGIDGMVLIGPQCPVSSPDNPCPDLPYEANIEIRRKGAGLVTHVRSEPNGTFRVGLRPGLYTLLPESGDPFPIAQAQDVEVRTNEFSEVTIFFDTGIR